MLTVASVMSRNPVIVPADTTVTRALEVMQERGISSVLVVLPRGYADYGILTMRDLVGTVVRYGLDPDALTVGDLTSWRLVTAEPSWSLQTAAATMTQHRVRRLPVTEGGQIIGLVSDTDLFTSLVAHHRWEYARQVRKERALRRAERTGEARTVADLMSAPVLSIGAQATAQDAVEKMVAAGISSLLVPDGGPGILTKRDVITKVIATGRDPRQVQVADVMSSPVRTIEPGAPVERCAARMADEGIRRLLVARGEQLVGIISDKDILSAVVARRWRGRRHKAPAAIIVSDVMRPLGESPGPAGTAHLAPELSLWRAAEVLAAAGAKQLPVVQDGKVIGVVTEADISNALAELSAPD